MTINQFIKSLPVQELADLIQYTKPGETLGSAAKRWIAERQLNITLTEQ